MDNLSSDDIQSDIAIIGMSGRFPKAKTLDQFWHNLREGRECISFFSDEDLHASGVDSALINNPDYVRAAAILEDVEWFDASFFGYNPREAEIIDPQQRLFLECTWEALEDSGCDTENYNGLIGVYAGSSASLYRKNNLLRNQRLMEIMSGFQVDIGNDKDYLSTRVSYKLNFKGPSVTVQTACSTSLVAVVFACQSLLSYQCDIALAGGVSIKIPQKAGYLYQNGMIGSPDGHCRAFDAGAQGTVSGDGIGIVILKRLADAIADNDRIRAVIKGSAVNNDGEVKIGYTAPAVDGQADVIAMAQAIAGVKPETVSYIEAHGTGTPLGDPIELAALTEAFRAGTDRKGFCAIGSVKSNIGHLDAAAGVAGLIKAVLALENKLLPPSLHFEEPNPEIDFENSPFYVNTKLSEWTTGESPRRAGVSSFGIGGTNAHVIVEEPPPREASGPSRPRQLLLLSAKTDSALETATKNLVAHLKNQADLNLADAAYTLQVGRREFSSRRVVVCQNVDDDAIHALDTADPKNVFTALADMGDGPVVFMFSGQGSQYVNMGLELYRVEAAFREQIDLCADILKPHLGLDLRDVLYPDEKNIDEATRRLTETSMTQPALFAIEYALATLLAEWGIRPRAMIGHSIGEYVAACIAGVFSLEDALELVAMRGRLIQELPAGAMLAVALGEKEIRGLIGSQLSLAAVNGASGCVISGTEENVAALQSELAAQKVHCRRLHTSHAFHSEMMESILPQFTQFLAQINLNPPEMKYISNVTGTWITVAEAMDPTYWARHLRHTVRFADGMAELLKMPDAIILEIGPGRTLATIARQQVNKTSDRTVLSSLPHPQEQESDLAFLLKTLGQLWLKGVKVDWTAFSENERRQRISLPTYPFERQRYWIEAKTQAPAVKTAKETIDKKPNIADWFYIPSWNRTQPPELLKDGALAAQQVKWLVFADRCGLGDKMAKRMEQAGQNVIRVKPGERFERISEGVFTVNPKSGDDYSALFLELKRLNKVPDRVVHLWGVTANEQQQKKSALMKRSQYSGFYSLLFLAQALGKTNPADAVMIDVVTNNIHNVTGEEVLCPAKAMVLGPCKVIPQEFPNLKCRNIDITLPTPESQQEEILINQIMAELTIKPSGQCVAYRSQHRWLQTYEAVKADESPEETPRILINGGIYLITGGLGGIGLDLSEYLARTVRAKLILTGRSAFPAKNEWNQWLKTHNANDSVSRKIRKLQTLEDLGAEVVVCRADAANLKQMQGVINQIYERFGNLHGVVHAAGIVAGKTFQEIRNADQDACRQQFQAKVNGLIVLEKVLQGRKCDFCLLTSSLSSILGGLSFASYSAGNVFMDAFAQKYHQINAVPWISVNWDAWRFENEAGKHSGLGAGLAELAIEPEEGKEVFRRLLSMASMPQLIVSTGKLQTRIEQWVALESSPDTKSSIKKELSPKHLRPDVSAAYVAPRNENEQAVAEIWQELLGIQRIGIYDNYFELGGDSLLAAQIISRVRDNFEMEFPLARLFETPTIAGLTEMIETIRLAGLGPRPHRALLRQTDTVTSSASFPLKRVSRAGDLPLSFAQERLWFLHHFEPDSVAYSLPQRIRLKGMLNKNALEKTFFEMARRHETLRTTFHSTDGHPVQRIAAEPNIVFDTVDLRHLPEVERDAEAKRLSEEDANKPFDLKRGPLFRIRLLQLEDQAHVLHFNKHHIISDYLSFGVVAREIAALYTALIQDKPADLPELPVQYADYAVWQRQWLQGEVLKKQLNYWKDKLGGELPVLELPTDRPRPAVQTHSGATESLALPKELTDALQAISRREGVTLFMTLLAAFKTLFYRLTGQNDIIVGTPIAGRNRTELEGLIGFFLNTIVMRTDLAGQPTFQELLGRVRETALGAYAHQDIPFEKLVEELSPERDLSRTPLFQVFFNHMAAMGDKALELPGLEAEAVGGLDPESKFDLTFFVLEDEGGIELHALYNTDLFDSWRMAQMLKQHQMLLASIVADSDQRISELSLLTEAERHQILVDWNDTAADYPEDQWIHTLFETQAANSPGAVAVIFGDEQLSYHELNRRANQLAHYLRNHGVGSEQVVGICMERCLEMIIGQLAILKAGGVFVALEPDFPGARLSFMLKDTKPGLLLTQQRLLEKIPEYSGEVVCLDRDGKLFEDEQASNLKLITTPDDLAYVTYTSGSTGKPKGILTHHRSVVQNLHALIHNYNLSAADIFLQLSSFSFDASVRDMLGPLLAGACIVVVNNDEAKDPSALVAKIAENQVTCILSIVPSQLTQLVEAGSHKGLSFAALRHISAAGEPLPMALCQRVYDVFGCSVVNQYGPTECTMISSYHRVVDLDGNRKIALIGRPIANTQFYILDDHLHPVPVGVAGEAYIGGLGVSKGYLNLPDLTAEKFIPNPFSNEPGARLYKTGDMVRYLPDSTMEFLGRRDFQVKLRGFRIELGEVEATLCLHPSVSEAVVVAREDRPGDKRLVAYVVAAAAQSAPATGVLRAFLQEKLPDYMIPSAFVSLDALPLTANRKVDRRALPAPELKRSRLETKFAAPSTQVEKVLAKIWGEVLGFEHVGVHDNFFDLGGHSLLATRVVSRIQQEFEVDLKLMHFFKIPTIAELTKRLEGLLWINTGRPSDDEAEFQDKEEGVV